MSAARIASAEFAAVDGVAVVPVVDGVEVAAVVAVVDGVVVVAVVVVADVVEGVGVVGAVVVVDVDAAVELAAATIGNLTTDKISPWNAPVEVTGAPVTTLVAVVVSKSV
jgi:hypothetical protein